MKQFISILLTMLIMQKGFNQQAVFHSGEYAVYNDKVVQGDMQATRTIINRNASNYKSPGPVAVHKAFV